MTTCRGAATAAPTAASATATGAAGGATATPTAAARTGSATAAGGASSGTSATVDGAGGACTGVTATADADTAGARTTVDGTGGACAAATTITTDAGYRRRIISGVVDASATLRAATEVYRKEAGTVGPIPVAEIFASKSCSGDLVYVPAGYGEGARRVAAGQLQPVLPEGDVVTEDRLAG
jgi:hypothetical protein